MTIVEVGQEIIHLLNPQNDDDISPTVVICWDESHSLINPVPNKLWTIFSELQRALRTIKELSFISVFLSTVGKFHHFSPSPEYDPSARLMHSQLKMLPPITEVCFDQFAKKVDCKEKWELKKVASTHHMAHLGRALWVSCYYNLHDTSLLHTSQVSHAIRQWGRQYQGVDCPLCSRQITVSAHREHT